MVEQKKTVDLRDKEITEVDESNFTLIRKLPPPTNVPFVGQVVDADGNAVNDASVFLLNTTTGNIEELELDSNGNFSTILDPNTKYLMKTDKEGYLVNCYSFKTPDASREEYELKTPVTLEKLALNTKLEVENVYYESGSAEITTQSARELDKVVQFMLDNPGIKVELGAHTDAQGPASSNKTLSAKRAKAARDYIVSKGIDASRISSKGYGESQLINKCKDGVECTKSEHAANRRTEIKITGFDSSNVIPLTLDTAFDENSSYSSCKSFSLKKVK